MKKVVTLLMVSIMSVSIYAGDGKAEVLYFKARLPCCQATACNNLENEVKSIIEKNFSTDKVVFRQVSLTETANKPLVDKYNAGSQTVVVVNNVKKKETVSDVSDIIRKYARTNDREEFEKDLVAKINQILK